MWIFRDNDHHASFYDVLMVEPEVRRLLKKLGIEIRLKTRITDVETDGDVITGVVSGDGEKIRADVFIETTDRPAPWEIVCAMVTAARCVYSDARLSGRGSA